MVRSKSLGLTVVFVICLSLLALFQNQVPTNLLRGAVVLLNGQALQKNVTNTIDIGQFQQMKEAVVNLAIWNLQNADGNVFLELWGGASEEGYIEKINKENFNWQTELVSIRQMQSFIQQFSSTTATMSVGLNSYSNSTSSTVSNFVLNSNVPVKTKVQEVKAQQFGGVNYYLNTSVVGKQQIRARVRTGDGTYVVLINYEITPGEADLFAVTQGVSQNIHRQNGFNLGSVRLNETKWVDVDIINPNTTIVSVSNLPTGIDLQFNQWPSRYLPMSSNRIKVKLPSIKPGKYSQDFSFTVNRVTYTRSMNWEVTL